MRPICLCPLVAQAMSLPWPVICCWVSHHCLQLSCPLIFLFHSLYPCSRLCYPFHLCCFDSHIPYGLSSHTCASSH
ncbi:hypothetical protein BS17DRAFT_194578 [Gyrodon lividus]|nr:hypothetical protein BS17DRAFT_194578 [Gyrodon lividus]